MSELTQNDENLFDILFNASVNQILDKLDISSAKYKYLALKTIKLVFEKIYKVQDWESAHKEPIVITATAIYLAVNNLGKIIQQEKIAAILKMKVLHLAGATLINDLQKTIRISRFGIKQFLEEGALQY